MCLFRKRGIYSYRIVAKRQYIVLEHSESISSGRSPHIDKRKTMARIEGFFPFTLAISIWIFVTVL
jgi:hypothetical protein